MRFETTFCPPFPSKIFHQGTKVRVQSQALNIGSVKTAHQKPCMRPGFLSLSDSRLLPRCPCPSPTPFGVRFVYLLVLVALILVLLISEA